MILGILGDSAAASLAISGLSWNGWPHEIFNVLVSVSKAGAAFKSLADAWADTTTPHGRLMLTVRGGLAEFERES
jgi:hypothetical protein